MPNSLNRPVKSGLANYAKNLDMICTSSIACWTLLCAASYIGNKYFLFDNIFSLIWDNSSGPANRLASIFFLFWATCKTAESGLIYG